MNQKAIVSIGILAVLLWLSLGVLLIIPWHVVGVLIPISIGIPTLLLAYEKGKANVTNSSAKIEKKIKEKPRFAPQKAEIKERKDTTSALLPNTTEITQLKIDSNFLDQIYEDARSKAIKTYNDVQLSYFCVQAIPFDTLPSVNIYFYFYSKWTNRICRFQYSSLTSDLRHFTPNKLAKTDFYTGIFNKLPWKTSPHFLQALSKTYDKIKPLPPVEGTGYSIYVSGNQKNWHIVFEDGLSGNDHRYIWDGLGLDETNFKELH